MVHDNASSPKAAFTVARWTKGVIRSTQVAPLVAAPSLPAGKRPTTISAFIRASTRRQVRSTDHFSQRKFRAFDAYSRSTSWFRILVVLVAVPLPGLFASFVPCFLQLQPIADGPNLAFYVHVTWVCACSVFGLLLTWTEVTSIPRESYSLRQLLLVTILGSLTHGTLFAWFSSSVLFPIPFSWVLSVSPLLMAVVLSHFVVLRSKLWRDPVFLRSLRDYGPSAVLQMSQLVVYPAVSILFDNVSLGWQVALTLLFPMLKWILKKTLRKLSRHLHDCSVEVAVCGIEIAASMYQAIIMQTSPTPTAMALIIGLDLMQGVVIVIVFMERSAGSMPTVSTPSGDERQLSTEELVPLARSLLTTATDEGKQLSDSDSATLAIALELMSMAEEILLAEYFEVVVPVINSLFLVVACHVSSARFNPRLEKFYDDPSSLVPALQSIVLYSLLQGLTFVAMSGVLRRRYGISSLAYLAFLLERHALSITGKMVAWLPFILHFTVVQYGVDFSFQFNWKAR